jgi:hypothetical protein
MRISERRPTGRRRPERAWWAADVRPAAILLSWLLFAQALVAVRAASITFDEGPHLAVGYATLRTGDLRLQPVHIHPPLANMLAAAPLLLNPDLPDPRSISGWEIASLSAVTDAVVWQYPHPARLVLAGRLPIILLTLLSGALVFRWVTDWSGAKAGLLALGLYALDPNVIAHGSLITTDMAVTTFGLLTFFLLHRHQRHPGRVRLVGAGLALGLALASKVSALLLLPLVGVVLLVKGGRRAWRQGAQAWLAVALVAFMTLWAVYRFELRPSPSLADSLPPLDKLGPALASTVPLPAATHLEIYRSLQEHYRLGHPAFLMGQNSDRGWWSYFPVAFAVKTPLPTLILLGAALIIFVRRRQPIDLTLTLFPLVHLVTALFSSVDIGYRHLLPALPFIYIFIARQLRIARPRAPNSRITNFRYVLVAGLTLWLAAETALVQPYPLTYFNELAGGPEGGYRWLVDSNLDWGQNLWQLRDWMRRDRVRTEGVERIYYSHFTPAHPEVYGVNADWLPPDPRAVPFAPFDPAPGIYVIGATTLQGVYTPDVNTFAWFRGHEPIARLGHALFVYEVPPREPVAWVAVCANPAPVLSPEAVRAGFGRSVARLPDLRVILMDCEQSWVYPASGGPGEFVLPPEAEPPPKTTLDVQTRHPDGKPFYQAYRTEEGGKVPRLGIVKRDGVVQPAQTVRMDGPLAFLGSWVDRQAAVYVGGRVELWTFWRVDEVPSRPLSLMGHMVEPDGDLIVGSDGLGVPIEQWQPGDIIIQRHQFQVPYTQVGSGSIRTGAYWLDTLERWSVWDEEGKESDQIELRTITILH